MSRFEHPEWKAFNAFFTKHLLHNGTHLSGSCAERDVLRAAKDDLWIKWKKKFADAEPLDEWVDEHASQLEKDIFMSMREYYDVRTTEGRDLLRIIMTLIRQWAERDYFVKE